MQKPTSTEQRIILSDVNWQQFETLLTELGEERATRLTYDRGKLELMTPLPEHDRCNRLIESLILVFADELHLTVEAVSPVLVVGSDRQRAAEFDGGYYLQKPAPDHARNRIDVTQSAPPDVLVEVAINKSLLNKFSIYGDLEIPEVWRYVTQPGDEVLKGQLLMYQLQDYQYIETQTSKVFPLLSAGKVLEFIQQSDGIGLVQALKILRHWIQEHL